MSTVTIPQGSIEYLGVQVNASHELDTQPVVVAVLPTSGPVAEDDWVTAAWIGDPGTSRIAQVLLDGTLDYGAHYVSVRITDSPEVPIIDAGMLWIR